MTAVSTTQPEVQPAKPAGKSLSNSTFVRVARYSAVRLVTLFVTVVIGVYLTIMIANMGGYVDQILRADIRDRVTQQFVNSPTFKAMAPDARQKLLATAIAQEEQRIGLNTPVAVRNLLYLKNALTLNLGRALNMTSDSGSKQVRRIILERMPATLLLMGSAELSLFFISVFFALALSRRYGSLWDKLVITLSPTSSAPPWFYGIFFILFFAAILKILPFGGMTD